jgi:hypothetical protein
VFWSPLKPVGPDTYLTWYESLGDWRYAARRDRLDRALIHAAFPSTVSGARDLPRSVQRQLVTASGGVPTQIAGAADIESVLPVARAALRQYSTVVAPIAEWVTAEAAAAGAVVTAIEDDLKRLDAMRRKLGLPWDGQRGGPRAGQRRSAAEP